MSSSGDPPPELAKEDDELALQFLDSLDAYLILQDSLTSTLRQGWLELASARHSMGMSRTSSSLYDLKVKSAATTLNVEPSGSHLLASQQHFILSKWITPGKTIYSKDMIFEGSQTECGSTQLRHRGPSTFVDQAEKSEHSLTNESQVIDYNHIQKERSKLLHMFGTMVPSKLRDAQVSFETALEIIVEIANLRSSIYSAHSRLKQEAAI